MIKILHLIETSGPGGAENILLSILSGLDPRKYLSYVGTLRKGWLTKELMERSVEVRPISSGGTLDFALVRNTTSLIRREGIDIVHSHLVDMNFYSSIAARICKVPHVCTEHGDINNREKLSLNACIKANVTSFLSRRIVFVSKFTERAFSRISLGPESKHAVIYNGIDEARYDRVNGWEKTQVRRDLLGLDESHTAILNVANLYPVKGHRPLLDAFRYVCEKLPRARLLIVGRGVLEKDLKEYAESIGLTRSVFFLGFREDVETIMKASDVFVLSSLSEGLPLALIEAMSCGLPVVATKVGGIPEVVEDGVDGFLVSPGDVPDLAAKILAASTDSTVAQSLTRNAYAKVRCKFTFAKMISDYERVYKELVR